MELTRRDAIAALAASGIAVGGAAMYGSDRLSGGQSTGQTNGDSDVSVETGPLLSLAEVLYPSEVTPSGEFVETYVLGRMDENDDYQNGVTDAMEMLDAYATEEYDEKFVELSVEQRESLLHDLDLENVHPDPAGTSVEQIRYFLVNELLYALFTTPTGGRLVGTENPTGHPGGLESYQQGPRR